MAQNRPPSGDIDEQDLMSVIKGQQITINNLTDLANEQVKIISQLISTAEPAAKAAVITALQTRVAATK